MAENMQHMDTIALKEWAVTIDALLQGEQIMILRKGGIVEETRDFRLASPHFFLLPTYEHQREELLKAEYQGRIARTLQDWDAAAGTVTIRAWAEAVQDVEISSQDKLDTVRELHMWTDSFAEERLKWKRKQPLHMLLLRVYKLESPITIPLLPAYTGCKSWVMLEAAASMLPSRPVLDDQAFARQREAVRQALEQASEDGSGMRAY